MSGNILPDILPDIFFNNILIYDSIMLTTTAAISITTTRPASLSLDSSEQVIESILSRERATLEASFKKLLADNFQQLEQFYGTVRCRLVCWCVVYMCVDCICLWCVVWFLICRRSKKFKPRTKNYLLISNRKR